MESADLFFMPSTIEKDIIVTPIQRDDLIIIPNNIYNDAVSYFPKELVDDIFIVTEHDHAGIIAHCNLYRPKKYTIDTRLSMVEKYNRAKISSVWIYVPIILLVVFIGIEFLFNTIDVTRLLMGFVAAFFASSYAYITLQYGLEKTKQGIAVLSIINQIVQVGIKQKLVDEYKTSAELYKEQMELAGIDAEEMRVRYEGALNYFHQRDPMITSDYIATMSNKPIFVTQTEVIQ